MAHIQELQAHSKRCMSDSELVFTHSAGESGTIGLHNRPKERSQDDLNSNNAQIHYIGPYIVETLNSPLPLSPKNRKKEQDKRRRCKEKWALNHKEWLIIESSQTTTQDENGKATKSIYHNTLVYTDRINEWRVKINEVFEKQHYVAEHKIVTQGEQTIWRESGGEKFLTFTYYKTKGKIMTHGTHMDIQLWRDIFDILRQKVKTSADTTKISPCDNGIPPMDQQDGNIPLVNNSRNPENSVVNKSKSPDTDSDPEQIILRIDKNEKTSISTVTDDRILSDEKEAENTDITPIINSESQQGKPTNKTIYMMDDSDDEYASAENYIDKITDKITEKIVTPHVRRKLPSVVASNRVPRLVARRTSIDSTKILERLDTLEGVVTGLQGGIVNVVNSVETFKRNTEKCVNNLIEKTETAINKINQLTNRIYDEGNGIKNSQISANKVEIEDIDKQWNIKGIMPAIDSIRQEIIDIRARMSEFPNRKANMTNKGTDPVALNKTQINKSVQAIPEEVTIQKVCDLRNKSKSYPPTMEGPLKPIGNDNKDVIYGNKADKNLKGAFYGGNYQTKDYIRTKNPGNRTQLGELYGHTNKEQEPRPTLIMGDSSINQIDRRRLLRNQIVSKSKAFTISEAREKIAQGGDLKENIIFHLGVNDLRDGESVDNINENIKDLVKETRTVHPESKVYLCSILPIQTSWADTAEVIRVNSYMENIPQFIDNIYYVDIFNTFIQEPNLYTLFEDDGLHPNIQGTIKMAGCIRDAVQPRRRRQRAPQIREERQYISSDSRAKLDPKMNNGHKVISSKNTTKNESAYHSSDGNQSMNHKETSTSKTSPSVKPQSHGDYVVPPVMPVGPNVWPIYPFTNVYPSNGLINPMFQHMVPQMMQ